MDSVSRSIVNYEKEVCIVTLLKHDKKWPDFNMTYTFVGDFYIFPAAGLRFQSIYILNN